ncbi:sulfatase [Haloarcula japonica]|uniref:sulfatase n=1 Tax=Haloarcula japonica TaxID=29282 RepID=UPI0039F6C3D8
MSEEAADPPNIIWITLDSIRHDHTTLNGHTRPTTPNLERIARKTRGVGFNNCIAAANWSLPSAASIHTGAFPERHRTGYGTNKLPQSVDTVAERLREQGYQTVGISANHYFSEATGLDRGFDTFKQINPKEFLKEVNPLTVLRFLYNVRSHSGGFTVEKTKHRPDFFVNEIVKKQLSSRAGSEEPFFLSAHYHGAHVPYYPPPAWKDRFASDLIESPEAASERAFRHTTDLHKGIANVSEFKERDWNALNVMYDTLIGYSDSLVGGLFDHMQSLDLGNTVFVVTADHGDLLGEYGLLGHKFVLHDGLVHVPAIVHGLDSVVGKADELVQHVDIMRTLVEYVGGDTTGLDGVDLRTDRRTAALSQRGAGIQEPISEIKGYNPSFNSDRLRDAAINSLRTHDFKYQHSAKGNALFELPDEESDVSTKYPGRLDELETDLMSRLDRIDTEKIDEERAEFSDDVRDHLSDLGYVVE